MYQNHSGIIGDLVGRSGTVPAAVVEDALAEHRESGRSLAEVLLEHGALERRALFTLIAEELGLTFVSQPPMHLEIGVSRLLAGRLAHRYQAVPLDEHDGILRLMVADPFNPQIVDDLSFSCAAPWKRSWWTRSMCRCFSSRSTGRPKSNRSTP